MPAPPARGAASGQHPVERFPVVGIGASAGGLAAFLSLLEHLPTNTGMAFVLIQHLSPTHESILPALLAKATAMPVLEITDGLPLAPDHVYINPPGASVGLAQGVLHLGKLESFKGQPRLIDNFLLSLAREAPGRAMGVILSGTGSDGTLGLRAIHEAGGTTLVQAPASALFDGMPRSALENDFVDYVLSPDAIAGTLALLANQPSPPSAPPLEAAALVELPEQDLQRLFHLLRASVGVDFTHYKPTTIHRRLERRMSLFQMNHLEDYLRYLETHPQELEALHQDLLIHVTSFFRDPLAFETLQQKVFPELLRNRPPNVPFRLWVPGCSSGEEAYSLIMALLEFLGPAATTLSIQAFATDLSAAAIDRARAAIYPPSITADVSPERLRRFFVKTKGGYQIHKSLRNLCVFARQNLVSDPPFSRMDLISCRNVLIYLGPVLQKKLLPIFHHALSPGGYLMLGTSESVGTSADLFSLVDKRQKLYRKKSTVPRPNLVFNYQEPAPAKVESALHKAEPVELAADPQREADRIVLARYAPPGVIINSDLEILHFRGHTGPYLEPLPGAASLNLLKMAREGLGLELRAAVHRAKKSATRVRKEGLSLPGRDKDRKVNLEVHPLRVSSGTRERYFLVLFEEVAALAPRSHQQVSAPKAAGRLRAKQRVEQLSEELAATKEHLQTLLEEQEATAEALRAANEEAQSSNEELQSTNEELEAAKEELQSTNEELTTVNEELQNRNHELSQLNSDLNNLLGSTHVAIVMLGNDLRIRRFTPRAEELLNLSSADIGRSLSDLQLALPLPDLEKSIVEVIERLSSHEQEVRDNHGHWYLLRLRPYKTLDNKIDGAVMTLMDIDRIKRSRDEARQAQAYADAIVDTLREPFLVLDSQLCVSKASAAFYSAFQVLPEQTLGHRMYSLGNGQWDIPRLRQLLEEILPLNTRLEDFLVEHDFEHIGHRKMLLNAHRISNEALGTSHILLSILDISHRTSA
jgi:two-component system CheB/CheR fusion protein